MAPKKIVVFGITGVQGGSVARALLADGPDKFEVWGVTRSKSSKKSQALLAQGIQLIEGDLDNPASYEEGLKGADNVWVNADFWQYYNGKNADEAAEREIKQNKAVIDTARRVGVPNIVFSCLDEFADADFKVPHCASKAVVAKYLREIGQTHTLVYPDWYFSNVLIFPKRKEGDKWIVQWPFPDDHTMSGFAAEQIGLFAIHPFRDPEAWNGKSIFCDVEHITPKAMAEVLSEYLGIKIVTEHITRERFYSEEFKNSMPEELYTNYRAILDGGMESHVEEAHKLVPAAWDFKGWVKNTPQVKSTWV